MWTYIYTDELYHHGIKGQKWGVRRFQNPDGTLTNAGKRRKAKGEYRDDLRSAVAESKSGGNKYATKYMNARLHRGSTYAKNTLGYGVAGAAAVGGVKAFKSLVNGGDKATIGKDFLKGAIAGGIGGMTIGALRSKRHIDNGELFAESNYGVTPIYERLNKLGHKPKNSVGEKARKSEIDRLDAKAKNEEASFQFAVKDLKQLKKSGPTGDMMRRMYGDDELTDKKRATELWKDELEYRNHEANISKARVTAYKKAAAAVSSMDITNAKSKDINRLSESVINKSFNSDHQEDKKYY